MLAFSRVVGLGFDLDPLRWSMLQECRFAACGRKQMNSSETCSDLKAYTGVLFPVLLSCRYVRSSNFVQTGLKVYFVFLNMLVDPA